MQFRHRSYEKEFLDNSIIATGDLYQNLIELDIINAYLGGYKASLKGLSEILKLNTTIKTILDIGFGGGDSIKLFSNFALKSKLKLFFYGVDLNNDCINYANDNLSEIPNKKLICDYYRNITPELLGKIDLIHCSLFLHHLNDEEIISLLKFCKQHNCILLANDLHRNPLAYYSIKVLTYLFSKSWMVKNDACLSVKRAFKKSELKALLEKAGYTDYAIKWSWAFRYIVIAYK